MDKMNLQINNDLEEQILNNYVAFWRHIIGDKRLTVRAKERPRKPLELLEPWKKERICKMCKIVFKPRWYYQIYCGNRLKSEGCAYLRGVQGVAKAKEIRLKNKNEK